MQRFFAWGLGFWVLLSLGCNAQQGHAPLTWDQEQEELRRMTATLEARAAANELRTYYPLARDNGYEQGRQCSSQAKGYGALHSCLFAAWEKSSMAQRKMPFKPRATSPCAQEIERNHRALLEAQPRLLRAQIDWLEAHRTKLSGPLEGKTLSALCEGSARRCDGQPADLEQAASASNVAAIACTQQLFICGSEEATCQVAGVTSRLGLDPADRPEGTDARLLVRATGRPLLAHQFFGFGKSGSRRARRGLSKAPRRRM